MIIADRPASPLARCSRCGVLERTDRHVCDPAQIERWQRETRRAAPLHAEGGES